MQPSAGSSGHQGDIQTKRPHLQITPFVQPLLYNPFCLPPFVQLLSLKQLKYTTPKFTTTTFVQPPCLKQFKSTTSFLQNIVCHGTLRRSVVEPCIVMQASGVKCTAVI